MMNTPVYYRRSGIAHLWGKDPAAVSRYNLPESDALIIGKNGKQEHVWTLKTLHEWASHHPRLNITPHENSNAEKILNTWGKDTPHWDTLTPYQQITAYIEQVTDSTDPDEVHAVLSYAQRLGFIPAQSLSPTFPHLNITRNIITH